MAVPTLPYLLSLWVCLELDGGEASCSGKCRFKSRLCHLQAPWPWISPFASLNSVSFHQVESNSVG